MKDIMLLICVASVFAGGYFFMKRLDRFLNTHVHPESERTQAGTRLKIGVADPLVLGSLSTALELFSGMKEEVSICLCSGTVNELLSELSTHRMDIALLPQDNESFGVAHVSTQVLTLKRSPVFLENGALSIEPVTRQQARYVVLWQTGIPDVDCFMKCLQRSCAVKE